ncbi:MAG TPA: PKD domain-containing protein, partial [Flavisolibacter sp.]|nr:PKD domain-containing protein [Flavisolibacter sp.]
NNLAGPVSIEPLYTKTVFLPYGDLEKSFVHIVTVNWKAGSKTLSAWVDGAQLITATADLVSTVFGGNPVVYWGFVASNTQATWYPATKELLFGYMRFSFGDIFPRIKTLPETDTCFGPPVQVFDSSVYGAFRGLSGLTNARWFWDFGDGQSSTDRFPPAHLYAKAGSYNIRFAVTNAFGCTFDTLVQKITLGALPVADFRYSAACANAPVYFTDESLAADGGIFHWEWDFAGSGSSTEQNPVFRFADTGVKTVRLKVRSNLGCEADTVKTVEINERPLLSFTHQQDCFGNVQYNAFLQNSVTVKSWQWRFGDGQTSVEQNPHHHFARNDTYTSLLSATSESGCLSDTIAQAIVVEVVTAFAG